MSFFFRAWRALSFNGIDGDYAEFGCFGGATFAMSFIESRRQRVNEAGQIRRDPHLWAFDSFEGLPIQQGPEDEHPLWQQGALNTSIDQFHQVCASHNIPRSEYTTVAGYYEKTLDQMTADHYPEDIALAYIDCDLYSSTISVLKFLIPRMKHGMIIGFDDYFCWSATQLSGERRAMLELLGDHDRWHLEPYIQFGWHGHSFVVEDKRLLGSIGR